MERDVQVREVGPRDGLQNEAQPITLADKLSFIDRLVAAGLRQIEVGAFVRADRVPQMADSDQLMAQLSQRNDGVDYITLVPNLRGLERAMEVGSKVIAVLRDGDGVLSGKVDHAITVPTTIEMLQPILTSIPLQMLAYEIAVRCGCSVDQPRNLAKSVTVE